ncbi:uncharacterized protein LOC124432965 isoform X1 [Vespa crabro]|uniref:uncharacterized protein LOC124432965 isoform X1 n=1 Tax=Vespa crabro TaxID=7445 RepID=UPI001F02A9CF|nr:uncharacterized protein LOC124432965 isoform X1 [Vespa crabro]
MALSLALPLSGIEAEHFYALGMRILYEQGLRTLNGIGPISPSIGSESSSGISSLTPSLEPDFIANNPNSTAPSSLANSAEDSGQGDRLNDIEVINVPCKVIYCGRDILNLGANMREPSWRLLIPYTCNHNNVTDNNSNYHLLSEKALTEEYPMVVKCRHQDKHRDGTTLNEPIFSPIMYVRELNDLRCQFVRKFYNIFINVR